MKLDKTLVILFFLFSVLHQIIGDKEDLTFLRLAQIVGIISFVRFLALADFKILIKYISFKIFIVCVIATVLVGFANGRLYLLNLIYPLSFISVSYLAIKSKPSFQFFVLITGLIFAFLIYKILQGNPPGSWIKGSRNYVSVLILYLTITTICIHRINNNTGFKMIVYFVLPLIGMFFCVLALGRAGILSSILLIASSLLYLSRDKLNRNKTRIFLLLIAVTLIPVIFDNFDQIEASYLYKFQTKGLELDERADVIDLYFDKINVISFIFSVPDVNSIYYSEGITLHNSYLHWHFSYGIGAIFIFILLFKSILVSFRRDLNLNILLVIILMRSFSDQILLSDGILMGFPLFLIIMINDSNSFLSTKSLSK